MGRKSYDSLGKPLPGRPNIVISRSVKNVLDQQATEHFKDMEAPHINNEEKEDKIPEGPFLFSTIKEGIDAMYDMAKEMDVDEVFITGGGQIYKETLPYTERLYLTVLDRDYDADVYFPEFDWDEWNIVSEEKHEADPEKDRPSFTFLS